MTPRVSAIAAIAIAMAGLLLWLQSAPAGAAVLAADGPSGIAVVPFAWSDARAGAEEAEVPDIASLLAGELARSSSARVVGPSALRGDRIASARPEASDFRRWAERNQVDRVVGGRASRRAGGALDVAVELRSGHSGATEVDYQLEAASERELPGAVEKLATRILADLGEADGVGQGGPEQAAGSEAGALPSVGAASRPSGDAASSSGTADANQDTPFLPGVDRDDPISIKSDELEVLPHEGGRRLIFSRNVAVAQGDIRLRADRLEAIYPQGRSQPERLTATGHVTVRQGERKATCQKATYVRTSQIIQCQGKAEIVEGCDRVRGDEIEFDLERDRVRVNGAASVVIQPEGTQGKCPRLAP
jgi:lipopolysaccharide export system protein LptA